MSTDLRPVLLAVLGMPLTAVAEFEDDPGDEITQDETTARAAFQVVPFCAA